LSEQEKAQPTQPKVFVRESTGLVKNVSFLDSISLNMSNMSIGPLFATLAGSAVATMVIVPTVTGLNLVAASIIAFVLGIPQVIVYTMMSRRFPRTGGDYVWLSRTFGGFWGSTLSFWGYTMETTAYLALVIILLDFAIGSVGLTMLPSSSSFYLNFFSSPSLQFEVGALLFTILIAINIVKPKAGFTLVSVLTVFGIFTLLLAIAVLLSAGSTGIANYVNSLGVNGATVTKTSSGLSLVINGTNAYKPSGLPFDLNFGNTIFIMPVIFAFVYPWLNAAPAVASEIKGKNALKWNVPISVITAFVVLTAALGTLYYVGGMSFINGLFANKAFAADGVNFFSLAMGVSSNSAIAWIIGIGWIAMQYGTIAYAVIVISRYLLAQSFDRFLPARVSYVSSRFGSPIVANLVTYVAVIVLLALATYYYASYSALFGAILASMIYFIFVGLCAATHAIRKEHGGAKILLAVAGVLDAGVFGFVSYQYLANTSFTSINSLTETFLVATFIAGALIYITSKWYNAKKGIDISLAYKELPPE
jgi:amino acid transporter